jgi:hypothetical protein
VNTSFDWGVGAWRQLSRVRPEWAEQAYAVLNMDALYPVKNKLSLGIAASDEIYAFASRSAGQVVETGMYDFTWNTSENPSDVMTEDAIWNLFGIPSVAARPGNGDKFHGYYRHSSLDSVEVTGFDDDAYRFGQLLFGKLILDLDEAPVRPLDLSAGIRHVLASLETLPMSSTRLTEALMSAAESASALAEDIEFVNMKRLESDDEGRASIDAAAINLNRELYALNRLLRDAFARFDGRGRPATPHAEASANVGSLNEALASLEKRDVEAALLALGEVGMGRRADYDALVCDYFAARDNAGTWAEGRETGPVCRADSVIRSIKRKIEADDPDMGAEIEAIETLLAGEEFLLSGALEAELSKMEEIAPRLEKAAADMGTQFDF